MPQPILISETQADYLDTEKSTAQTVAEMGRHVRSALHDPRVYGAALAATNGGLLTGPRRTICCQVWGWLKRNVRFVRDEDQLQHLLGRGDELELLISPAVLVRANPKEGDCDDFTMLGCAMLLSLGVPTLIKTYKCDRQDPTRWSHVCAAAILEDGSVFPLDASHGQYPGWEVPAQDQFETALWDMNGNRVGGGLAGVRRRRGLGSYLPEKSWTGDPMTTVGGPAAGPYPSLDVMRLWYPGRRSRAAGLAAIAGGKWRRGLGQDDSGDDTSGDTGGGSLSIIPGTSVDQGISTVLVTSTPYTAAIGSSGVTTDPVIAAYLNNPTGTPPTTSSTGIPINWNAIVASLTSAGAKLGSQALLTPGSVVLPNGTVIAGTPQGTSNFSFGGISSGTLILLAAALGLVLVLKK